MARVLDARRLKRVILSLPDAELRREWLESELATWPTAIAAHVLNDLLEESEAAEPDAREALLTVALLFVGRGDSPLAEQMRREASEQRLFSLARLLRKAPRNSVPPVAEQPAVPPDYGAGRELTLGERRSLARRPNRRVFDKLLADPHPLVIRQLLKNPKMIENDAIRLAARRPARASILKELARSAQWMKRSRVRMAILLNPGSPPEISLPLLGLCNRTELREVMESADAPLLLRATARELFDRRPPMQDDPKGDRPLQ